jgi:hypothetical protein
VQLRLVGHCATGIRTRLPADCETAWAGEVEIIAAQSLLAIVNDFKGCGYRKWYPGWRRCRDGLSSRRDD